jgi:hypothetical protein
MAEFPKLKTGARAQYPLTSELSMTTRVLPFLDGAEQRYPVKRARRRWVVELEMLDESEAAVVEQFVRTHLETLETFTFTDPWSGTAYTGCVLENAAQLVTALAEGRCRTSVAIAEGAA